MSKNSRKKIIKEIGVYVIAFTIAFVLHKILNKLAKDIGLVLQKFMPFEYYSRIDLFIIFGIPALISILIVKKMINNNWKAVITGLITLVLLFLWFILKGYSSALR